MSDIVWEAHELEWLPFLAEALREEILRSLEPLAGYRICVLSSFGCEGKRLGHVQSIVDNLRVTGLVDYLYDATEGLECHTSMPAACAQICAKLKWAGMVERSDSYEDPFKIAGVAQGRRVFCPSRVAEVLQKWMVSKEAAHATEAD